MDTALFDWCPVRDARKARFFLGAQVLLGIYWTVSGILRHDSVFVWLGPVFVAVLLVAILRPRFVVERDRIWWRGVVRTQSVPLDVVEAVRRR